MYIMDYQGKDSCDSAGKIVISSKIKRGNSNTLKQTQHLTQIIINNSEQSKRRNYFLSEIIEGSRARDKIADIKKQKFRFKYSFLITISQWP